MDSFPKEKRSQIMSKVRGKNTTPELIVRKALFSAGFRYRLHIKTLLGHPDIVLQKYKAVIFVHGCFWHGHYCRLGKLPVGNKKYWLEKIGRNRTRDQRHLRCLTEMGWRVLTIWECKLLGKQKLQTSILIDQIRKWLVSNEPVKQIPNEIETS